MIDDIFAQELGERSIFTNASVLSPHYVPDELPHREREAEAISRLLAPLLRGERAENIFLYGKTGTGKTSVARYVASRLEAVAADAQKNPHNVAVKLIYTNCKIHSSRYQALIRILEDAYFRQPAIKESPYEGRTDHRLTGLTPGDLYDRLLKVTSANGLRLVFILDEIDVVKDLDELVYALTRINDELERGHVAVMGISNKYGFKERLDPRSKSTLCANEIVFKPYNAGQLATILGQRARLGLKEGAVDEPQIELIAAIAAKTNGDARYALRLLRTAGELAQSERKPKLTASHVKEAAKKVEEDLVAEVVSSLPEHQQVVLYAVADTLEAGSRQKRLSGLPEDTLSSGEVYDRYEALCRRMARKPRTLRWFREYLNDLEMLGLVSLSISGKGVRGNTTLIHLGYPAADIKSFSAASLGIGAEP